MDMDYGYIESGGFLLACEDVQMNYEDSDDGDNRKEQQVLGVTKEQADILLQNCPFFEKCLRDSTSDDDSNETEYNTTVLSSMITMKEAKDRIVHKPDWSLAIARHFVEVMTKGKTAVPTLELYKHLMAAGDQMLMDFRLTSFVNYMDACSKENDFMRLVDPSLYCFRFLAQVTGDEWLSLLDQNVLLYRQETNYVVQRYKEDGDGLDQDQVQCLLKDRTSEFNEKRRATGANAEAFSIYFETMDPIPKDHHQLIDRLAGGEAYIRTCADAVEHQTEGYTVKASLDVLLRAIRPVQESSAIHCSFRVDNPTPDTLGRFVNACQRAKVHTGTLGLDVSINRYFCRKSMSDIKTVLEYMKDYATSSKINGDFQIQELSSENKTF
ncbi:MAG: hypothetical protein SGARI_004647 [Bacillariaceae sp.]